MGEGEDLRSRADTMEIEWRHVVGVRAVEDEQIGYSRMMHACYSGKDCDTDPPVSYLCTDGLPACAEKPLGLFAYDVEDHVRPTFTC